MAVSRYVPQNIKKYKPKLFWGFTSRQIISLIVTAVTIFISLKLMKNFSTETKIYLCSLPAVVPICIGFVHIYGMPLEKFIPQVIHDHFRCSQKRYLITAPSITMVPSGTTASKGVPASLGNQKKQKPLKMNHKNKAIAVAVRHR